MLRSVRFTSSFITMKAFAPQNGKRSYFPPIFWFFVLLWHPNISYLGWSFNINTSDRKQALCLLVCCTSPRDTNMQQQLQQHTPELIIHERWQKSGFVNIFINLPLILPVWLLLPVCAAFFGWLIIPGPKDLPVKSWEPRPYDAWEWIFFLLLHLMGLKRWQANSR